MPSDQGNVSVWDRLAWHAGWLVLLMMFVWATAPAPLNLRPRALAITLVAAIPIAAAPPNAFVGRISDTSRRGGKVAR